LDVFFARMSYPHGSTCTRATAASYQKQSLAGTLSRCGRYGRPPPLLRGFPLRKNSPFFEWTDLNTYIFPISRRLRGAEFV
jgi:hypothetical protein